MPTRTRHLRQSKQEGPPQDVEASRFIRKMRGGAQTCLIESANGGTFVVKFTNNPQHARVVMNEWIAACVFRHLGVATPETAIVNLSDDFIRDNPAIYMEHRSSGKAPTSGPHFGSRFPQVDVAVYDFLPDAILSKVDNISDFLGVLVADKWLGNTDSRQAIFFRDRGVRSRFVVQMIDNGHIFGGGVWRFADSPLLGPYFGKVYDSVRSIKSFDPWLASVASFPKMIFEDAFRRAPDSWSCGSDEAEFGKVVDQLMRRRGLVAGLIDECHAQPTRRFPNWP